MSGAERSWIQASDSVVRARLAQEMTRLDGADAFAALGLPKSAKEQQIRSAFLELTKTFHPNRFARRGDKTRRLATEVFLAISQAYARLSSDDARTKTRRKLRAGRTDDTTQLPIPVSSAGEVLKAPTSPAAKRAMMMPRRPRRGNPGPKRATEPTPSVSVAFKKSGAAKKSADAAAKPEVGLGSDKPKTRPPKPMTVDEMRRQRRRERNASQRKPSTQVPTVQEPKRTEIRDPESVTREVVGREEKRKETFKAATALLRQGQLATAKEMYRQLAIENPTVKSYRVYMHYAWGRELHAAGRDQEALVEYNRALGLDPNFEQALKSVASLRLGGPKKQGGLLSKFFRKE